MGSASATLRWLGAATGIAYIVGGVAGAAIWESHWEEATTTDRVMWFLLLAGGGVLLFVGLWLFPRAPWVGAILVSLGAIAGAPVVFWTIVVLLVAVVLIVLSLVTARRMSR